jgi:hypothetical protein
LGVHYGQKKGAHKNDDDAGYAEVFNKLKGLGFIVVLYAFHKIYTNKN